MWAGLSEFLLAFAATGAGDLETADPPRLLVRWTWPDCRICTPMEEPDVTMPESIHGLFAVAACAVACRCLGGSFVMLCAVLAWPGLAFDRGLCPGTSEPELRLPNCSKCRGRRCGGRAASDGQARGRPLARCRRWQGSEACQIGGRRIECDVGLVETSLAGSSR